jgi:anaerobic magnesium-protoporphyrin IX monomethyl ester cyclase
MRVQLINPPVYLNVHALTALRPSMPLGLAYIAATLRREGHRVSVVDAVAAAPDRVTQEGKVYRLGLSPEEIVVRLDPAADAFAVTNMWSFSWPLVRTILQQIKARYPDKLLIAGGEHFTGLPEHSLRQAPIDYIVLGEGEDAAVELFRAMETRQPVDSIRGLAFLRDGLLVRTPTRERTKAIDDLPWPAWDLFDLETYNQHDLVTGLHAGMTVPILATRGCPYQCTYCSSPNMWTTRYYTRAPKDVVDEMEHYHRNWGARNFPFQDLTAIVKRQWILDFCNELLARKLEVTWQFPSGTRCEVIDDEVARLLFLTGGKALAFAPESGSERTRKLIKKQMKTESLLNAVKASVKNKLNITAFIVIGFPHDEPQDLKETTKLARKLAYLGIDDVAIGFFFPIPNTELYDQLIARGRIQLTDEFLLTPIFANDEKLLPENNYCDHLSARQLTWWKYRILLSFYGVSFALRPWRVFTVLFNALRGKETRKLETFLVELKRKGTIWLKGKLGMLPGRPALPAAVTTAK